MSSRARSLRTSVTRRSRWRPGPTRHSKEDVPRRLTVRGEEVRLLVTLEPAGAEYFFVPRDDSDNDPAKFGLIIQAAARAM